MLSEEILSSLLADIKIYLDITWEGDVELEKKLKGMIQRGIKYIEYFSGKQMDYQEEGSARALLFDYVRYARSGSVDRFMQNYQSELLMFQMENLEVTDGD